MIKDFYKPQAKYRIKPFWFWNGILSEEIIESQINEMKDKGIGGFFICPRQGQTTAYLSEKWFSLVKYACKKAHEVGLEAWLYDEYPYPSGMSGGEVLLEHPESQHKVLNFYEIEAEGPVEKQIRLPFTKVLHAKAYAVQDNGTIDYDCAVDLTNMAGNLQTTELYQICGLTDYNQKRFFTANPERIFEIRLMSGRWSIRIYTENTLGDFKYYGKFFDPCDKNAVQTFLKTTHERYHSYMGEMFSYSIKGMFSDEVGLLSPIPWSAKLPAYFVQRNGYSILEHLPALHDGSYPNAWKVRYDLYNTIHKLFVESYHKQTAGWCMEHNLDYATEVPSMRLTTQRYSTVIGGDASHEKIGRSLEWIYDKYLHHYRGNAIAVSSLQRQLGRKYAMIESFHSVGWTMTIQDAKWMLDRLAASGINFYNVHAFYYTIGSINKHDAPPSQFLQNPYWKYYGQLADYAARLSTLVINTESCIDIAVLDPIASLWTCVTQPFSGFEYSGTSESEKKLCSQLRDDWVFICKSLLFNQICYEHLDTELLAEATVEQGKLYIGKAVYSTIIMPPTLCIERFATEKLKQFIAEGGNVIALGMLPSKVIDSDKAPHSAYSKIFGIEESHIWNYLKAQPFSGNVQESLIRNGNNVAFYPTRGSVSCADTKPWLEWCSGKDSLPILIVVQKEHFKSVVSAIRTVKNNDGWYVFVANQEKLQLTVTIRRNSSSESLWLQAEEHSIENGLSHVLGVYKDNIEIVLLPYQSRLIHIKETDSVTQIENTHYPVVVIDMKKPLPVTVKNRNIYRLDTFDMSIHKHNWIRVQAKTFIEQYIDSGLFNGSDFNFTSNFGIPRNVTLKYPLKAYYRQSWQVLEIPNHICLLMDRHSIDGKNSISINGKTLPDESWHPHFVNDHNNILADIQPYIILGKNTIEIEVNVEKDADGIRDPLYLYGDFGVEIKKDSASLVAVPETAVYHNSYVEGFPFYSGTFYFKAGLDITDQQYEELAGSKEVEFTLNIGKELYHCFEITVNGEQIGTRAFAPYIWRLPAKLINRGYNDVNIMVTNTLSNMLDGTYFDYDAHQIVSI